MDDFPENADDRQKIEVDLRTCLGAFPLEQETCGKASVLFRKLRATGRQVRTIGQQAGMVFCRVRVFFRKAPPCDCELSAMFRALHMVFQEVTFVFPELDMIFRDLSKSRMKLIMVY